MPVRDPTVLLPVQVLLICLGNQGKDRGPGSTEAADSVCSEEVRLGRFCFRKLDCSEDSDPCVVLPRALYSGASPKAEGQEGYTDCSVSSQGRQHTHLIHHP